jgi:hypothetical protein
VIEQPEGAVDAVQLKVVPLLVVLEAFKPAGVLGTPVQLPPLDPPSCQSAGTLGGSQPT